MNPQQESFVRYDDPVLAGSLRVSPKQPAVTGPAPPSAEVGEASAGTNMQQKQEILNAILPPREWMEANQMWVQQASSTPSTKEDVVCLKERLDVKLKQRQARGTGICPVRRQLYSQCFDELIRQVTVSCAERGLLLSRVREEIQTTMAAYQALCESSEAFSASLALNAMQTKADLQKRISELEIENRHLKEQKAEWEAVRRREIERGHVEEQKHKQKIQYLKRRNQQLKGYLEEINSAKK